MTQRSRANEIPRLIQSLASLDRRQVDAARARLAIIGERAVEHLIEALEGNDARLRGRAMPLLALIRDPRGREPLMAGLLEQDPRLREIAIRCLARFPTPDVVAALNRKALKDPDEKLRIAALRSLIEQVAAGNESAIRVVLDRLLDEDEAPAIRTESLALIRSLGARHRRVVIDRLSRDPDETLRAAAASMAGDSLDASEEDQGLEHWIEDLASPDYAVWDGALARLAAAGEKIVRPLARAMEARSHDPEYCTRAGMALKALGPQRARAIGRVIDEIAEPLPLRVLVDVIGSLGEKPMIYRLSDLIHRVAQIIDETPHPRRKWLERVRAKAHLELSRIGSRVAIADLREALTASSPRVELELIAAAGRIGKREEIPLLLEAWEREEPVAREHIGEAVREIVRRERIRRSDRIFGGMEASQRRTLVRLWPLEKRGNKSRRTPRAPSA
jgi:HEAT repeat protein